jgi:hypothetical protein
LEDHGHGVGAHRQQKLKSNLNVGAKYDSDSDDDEGFRNDIEQEVSTFKRGMREKYETAINSYAPETEFFKKNF